MKTKDFHIQYFVMAYGINHLHVSYKLSMCNMNCILMDFHVIMTIRILETFITRNHIKTQTSPPPEFIINKFFFNYDILIPCSNNEIVIIKSSKFIILQLLFFYLSYRKCNFIMK